jgi:hypothetical protein
MTNSVGRSFSEKAGTRRNQGSLNYLRLPKSFEFAFFADYMEVLCQALLSLAHY